MNIINQESELTDVRLLKPHPKNPNRGSVDAIAKSITANGFYGAVIAQRSTGHILVGHHRLEAAKQLGAAEVPVIWVDVDDTRALKIMLADNKTAEAAHRDAEALADLLAELQTADTLTGTGYVEADLDALLASITPPAADDWGASLGKLSSEDRQPFQQMTFTLHDEQAEQIKAAVKAAQAMGPFTGSPNENSNGNALARICEAFLTGHG